MKNFDEQDDEKIEEDQRRKKIQADLERQQMQQVLSMPQGRAVFWRLLSRLNLFSTSMNASGSVMYFNEGRKSVAYDILNDWLDANEETFYRTMKENKKGETTNA